jgi:hypothetical protein
MSSRDLAEQAPSIADAMQHYLFSDIPLGLRYSLLRLELAGLTERDRADLLELGRLAISELDVSDRVKAIVGREDASPLAVAIAELVSHARTSKRAAMLGAVYGAYAGAQAGGEPDELPTRLAIIGAAAGASAQDAHAFLETVITQSSWSQYLAERD